MGKLILVTGGARSGKSSFAEEHAKGFGRNILYIATAIPFDDEMKLRVKKHREQRSSDWETLEAYRDFDRQLEDKLHSKSAVLLDCITIMVSNIILETGYDWERLKAEDILNIEATVDKEINKLVSVIKMSGIPFVLVTNELGMGIVPENALARLFRDIAGRMNQFLAREAQEVFLCVSGIPLKIKG